MKYRFFYFLCTLLVGVNTCFAEIKEEVKVEDNGFKWIELYDSENGYSGVKTIDGKEIISTTLKINYIFYDSKNLFKGVYFDKELNITYCYFDLNGKQIFEPGKYTSILFYERHAAATTLDGKIGIYTLDGKEIITHKYTKITMSDNGYFCIEDNGKHGICSLDGNEIVPPIYEEFVYYSAEGFKSGGKKLGIFLPGHDIRKFVDNKKEISTDKGKFIINIIYNVRSWVTTADGKEIIPPSLGATYITWEDNEKNSYFLVRKKDGDSEFCGIYRYDGNVEVPLTQEYEWCFFECELTDTAATRLYKVKNKQGEYGIYRVGVGEIIPPGKYDYPSLNTFGFSCKGEDDTETFCDFLGRELFPLGLYTYVYGEKEGYIKVMDKNENYGAYDLRGNLIVPVRYQGLVYNMETGFASDYGDNILGVFLPAQISSKLKDMFDRAYAISDTEPQAKFDAYMAIAKEDPNNEFGYKALAYNNIGCLLMEQGDLNSAKDFFESAVAIDPSYNTAQNNLSSVKSQISSKKWQNIANTLTGISNALSNAAGYRMDYQQSFGDDYGSFSDSDYSNGNSSSRNFQAEYDRWEQRAERNYNSLTTTGHSYTDKEGNKSGSTHRGMNGGNYVRMKQLLREAQSQMRNVRQKAARAGITIQQSKWETVVVSY